MSQFISLTILVEEFLGLIYVDYNRADSSLDAMIDDHDNDDIGRSLRAWIQEVYYHDW